MEEDLKKHPNIARCGVHGSGCKWESFGIIEDLEHCKNCKHLIMFGKDEIVSEDEELKDLFEETDKAMRFNEGKPKWSLVHYKSMEPMIRVLEFVAQKYAPKNWMKPMNTTEILESMQRHLAALMDGEEVDQESGISHMGHIQANAMFYNYHKGKETLLNIEGNDK